jgi:hypothetical protein
MESLMRLWLFVWHIYQQKPQKRNGDQPKNEKTQLFGTEKARQRVFRVQTPCSCVFWPDLLVGFLFCTF